MRKQNFTKFFAKAYLIATMLFCFFANKATAQQDFVIGTGTTGNTNSSYPCPLQDFYEGSRAQYLYKACELNAMGMGAGNITQLKYVVTNVTNTTGRPFVCEQMQIKIGTTTTNSLSPTSWETLGGTVASTAATDYTPVMGDNIFIFTAPFFWNGTDNIVIEICGGDPISNTQTSWSINPTINWTTNLSFNASHTYRADNQDDLCGTALVANSGTLTTRPDITFTAMLAPACTIAPPGGVATTPTLSVCDAIPFTITIPCTIFGVSGITFQWQDSSAGTWNDIAGATEASYTQTTGISAPTCFRRKSSCGALFSYSNKLCFTILAPQFCLCGPNTSTVLHTAVTATIDSVGLQGTSLQVSNVGAAPNGYTLTTAPATIPNVTQNSQITLKIKTSAAPSNAGVWVDWDQSGTFETTEFQILKVAGNYSSVVLDVPETATPGLCIMRIRTRGSAIINTNACTSFTNGETEDFIVNVLVAPTCTSSPNGGVASASATSTCPNAPFILTTTGATMGVTGLTYQWQDSSATASWTDIAGGDSLNMNISAGITINTCYRRKITCGATSSYSTKICVTILPVILCPCSPATGTNLHGGTSPSIDSVALIGTVLNIQNIGVPSNGYTANVNNATKPYLLQNNTYNLVVKSSGTVSLAAVWIDWDQSGTFEASEYNSLVFNGVYGNLAITPPSTSGIGDLLMRIRIRAANFTPSDACATFFSGETEDYILNVDIAPPCTGTPVGGTTVSNVSSACLNTMFTLSVTGGTAGFAGLSYSWQDSASGVWSDIGVTDETYTTSITTNKYYRRKITCGANSSYSSKILISYNAETYASLPYAESFEGTWIDGCGISNSKSIPSNSWRNNPLNGDSSWRRNDNGGNAGWINGASGAYTPAGSVGNFSARFHSFQARRGSMGSLDVFVNCTGGSTEKRLTFDHINTSGTDALDVLYSTDGGTTFTSLGITNVNAAWTQISYDVPSQSATTVIRFSATSDFGVSDIGIDNLLIGNIAPVDISAKAIVAPVGTITTTNAGEVTVNIKNAGSGIINPITKNITVGCKIYNPSGILQPIVSKVVNSGSSLNPTDELAVNITMAQNFLMLGTWKIKCGATISTDGNLLNDSTGTISFTVLPTFKFAVASGSWGDGATWSDGVVPNASDSVSIPDVAVTLDGTSPSPYACNSLTISRDGSLTATANILNVGAAAGSNRPFIVGSTGGLLVAGGTININGFLQIHDNSNFSITSGNINIDGNSGTNATSVLANTPLMEIGIAGFPYQTGTLDISGGMITIVDPHRFSANAISYRGLVPSNINPLGVIRFGDGVSNHTVGAGNGGFLLGLNTSGQRLTLPSIIANGGNTVAGRFVIGTINIGIGGSLTINANSEFRMNPSNKTFVGGNFTNNGLFVNSGGLFLQTYEGSVEATVTVPQTISGTGLAKNNVPTVTITTSGTGYAVGDIITLAGGTATTPATYYVSAVNGTGGISNAVMFNLGNYSVMPTSPASITGGTGTGAKLTVASLVSTANFGGLIMDNDNAAGVTITSLGTQLATYTGNISGTLNLFNTVVNNPTTPITLGTSVAIRGTLINGGKGFLTGKLNRWFGNFVNSSSTGDLPVSKGTIPRNARVEFTTAPTKGGIVTAEYIATAPTKTGLPLNDAGYIVETVSNNGFWRIDVDSITGGNYTISITDSGIVNAQTLSSLRIIKRPSNTTTWTLNGTHGTNTGSLTKPTVVRNGLAGFSEFAIAGGIGNLLPFKTIKLAGERVATTNVLNWTITNEFNVNGFEIERSTDGNNFVAISFVKSKLIGTTAQNLNYNYSDIEVKNTTLTYRLKVVDKDGKYAYSNTITIKANKANILSLDKIYPNPATTFANLLLESPTNNEVTLVITDVAGCKVFTKNVIVTEGTNIINLDISKFTNGNYFVKTINKKGENSNVLSLVK
jgi:GEVED domain/Secretion system C-terminal sorting domain